VDIRDGALILRFYLSGIDLLKDKRIKREMSAILFCSYMCLNNYFSPVPHWRQMV